MKQAILYGAGDLRIEERPLDIDSLKDHQVYVETEVTALSTGTDLGNYLGKSTEIPGAPDYPRPVGYSNVGVIRRVGHSVRHLRPGQRVFSLKPHLSGYIAEASESAGPCSRWRLFRTGVSSLSDTTWHGGDAASQLPDGRIGGGDRSRCDWTRYRRRRAGDGGHRHRSRELIAAGGRRHGRGRSPRVCSRRRRAAGGRGSGRSDGKSVGRFPHVSVEMARHGGRISVLGFPGRGEPAPDFNPFDPKWFYGKQLTLIGAGHSPRTECPPAEIRFNLRRNLEYIFRVDGRGIVAAGARHHAPAPRGSDAGSL